MNQDYNALGTFHLMRKCQMAGRCQNPQACGMGAGCMRREANQVARSAQQQSSTGNGQEKT